MMNCEGCIVELFELFKLSNRKNTPRITL